MGSLSDWLEKDADRILSNKRANVESAKLVVTFAAAVAATFVATALQVDPDPSRWDYAAVVSFVISFVSVFLVIELDRALDPVQADLVDHAHNCGWTEEKFEDELRTLIWTVDRYNERAASDVQISAMAQVLLSMLTCALAVTSLLT